MNENRARLASKLHLDPTTGKHDLLWYTRENRHEEPRFDLFIRSDVAELLWSAIRTLPDHVSIGTSLGPTDIAKTLVYVSFQRKKPVGTRTGKISRICKTSDGRMTITLTNGEVVPLEPHTLYLVY